MTFFNETLIPILVSRTMKTRKFKLLYFRNETCFGAGNLYKDLFSIYLQPSVNKNSYPILRIRKTSLFWLCNLMTLLWKPSSIPIQVRLPLKSGKAQYNSWTWIFSSIFQRRITLWNVLLKIQKTNLTNQNITTVKPLLSGHPIKWTPSPKGTLSRVPKRTSDISLYNETLFSGHFY